jgi:imidazolonepropionase-like amidohydrolase
MNNTKSLHRLLSISFLILLGLFTRSLNAQNGAPETTYIYCGKLIDTEKGEVLNSQTIIVEGATIKSVVAGYQSAEAGVKIIDLKKFTVMPGLMDMHVHIEHESNPNKYLEKYTLNDADIAYMAQLYGMKTLMAGFTTVRDLGGTGVNVAYRNAINEGTVDGPRIFTCEKSIATTGGHADPTNGAKRTLLGDPGPDAGVVNSPEDARKAVRQRYKNGADCIKITATGGVLSVAASGLNPQFMDDELEAIIQTSRDYGFHTAAHAHGAEGMKRAVIAGITSIEHGTYMTDEIMDLMIEKGTYYVPTISAGKFVADKARIAGFYPHVVALKAAEIGPKIQDTFSKAYKKGVKIAFGTDSGVSLHGENADEFIFMVEAGMPAMKAIQSATMTSAELLGLKDKLGSIKPGKYADIIAVEGNPLDDVRILKHVQFVMKDGKIYKSPLN